MALKYGRTAFFAALFLFIFVLPSTSAMALSTCPRNTPKVILKTYATKTRLIRSKSANDLTMWQTGHTNGGMRILGLGGGEMGSRLQVEFNIVTLKNGGKCAQVKTVFGKFYAKPQIHIANNFQKGTCEYKAVMIHEKKHIAALKGFLREYSPKYEAELKRIVKKIPNATPVSSNQVASEEQETINFIKSYMYQYEQKIFSVLSGRQQKIDSATEYKLVASKCDKWEEKLAQNN
ncbi:MAG: hypothetical protein KDI13_08380 [Alphaproteobacteria bacterium]|nr:hypothetical protein [Alphaproteobacteria bacterium]